MGTVNTEALKPRSIPLVRISQCIYFWLKLIDGRWSPSNHPMSEETFLNSIFKSFGCRKQNPMSINSFSFFNLPEKV
jgi:hypothetical protein